MANVKRILKLRAKQLSYRAIGVKVGLSGERVRQILIEQGVHFDHAERQMKSEARRQLILKLNKEGLTQQEIAKKMGLKSYTQLGDVLRKEGIYRWEEHRKRLYANDPAILELRKQGLTYRQIASRLGLPSTGTISNSLKRSGYPTVGPGRRPGPKKTD